MSKEQLSSTRRPVLLRRRTQAVLARRAVRGPSIEPTSAAEQHRCCTKRVSRMMWRERAQPSSKGVALHPCTHPACERVDLPPRSVQVLRVAQTCCRGAHAATPHSHACVSTACVPLVCTGARHYVPHVAPRVPTCLCALLSRGLSHRSPSKYMNRCALVLGSAGNIANKRAVAVGMRGSG